jgi:hypothetical protein
MPSATGTRKRAWDCLPQFILERKLFRKKNRGFDVRKRR